MSRQRIDTTHLADEDAREYVYPALLGCNVVRDDDRPSLSVLLSQANTTILRPGITPHKERGAV